MTTLHETKSQKQRDTTSSRVERGECVGGRLAWALGALSRLDRGEARPGGDGCSSGVSRLPVVVDAPADPRVEAYVEVLMRETWEWFCTFTFANQSVHPERALKAFEFWVVKQNRVLFGANYRRKGRGLRWVLGLEHTRAGVVHFHVLIAGVGNTSRSAAKKRWAGSGFSKIEAVRDSRKCCSYVAKYVAKGGEVYFGEPEALLGVAGPGGPGKLHGGSLRGGDVSERRFVERSPLFVASGEHRVSEVYANGFLRPDEYMERNERMEALGAVDSSVGEWTRLDAANGVVVRGRARASRGKGPRFVEATKRQHGNVTHVCP